MSGRNRTIYVGEPPEDVRDWAEETYTDEGLLVWLGAWEVADQDKRTRMVTLARTDSGGT